MEEVVALRVELSQAELVAFIARMKKETNCDARKRLEVLAAAKSYVSEAGGDISADSMWTKRITRAMRAAYGNVRPPRKGAEQNRKLAATLMRRAWPRLTKTDLNIVETKNNESTERATHIMFNRPSVSWHLGNSLLVLMLNTRFTSQAAENLRAGLHALISIISINFGDGPHDAAAVPILQHAFEENPYPYYAFFEVAHLGPTFVKKIKAILKRNRDAQAEDWRTRKAAGALEAEKPKRFNTCEMEKLMKSSGGVSLYVALGLPFSYYDPFKKAYMHGKAAKAK